MHLGRERERGVLFPLNEQERERERASARGEEGGQTTLPQSGRSFPPLGRSFSLALPYCADE